MHASWLVYQRCMTTETYTSRENRKEIKYWKTNDIRGLENLRDWFVAAQISSELFCS